VRKIETQIDVKRLVTLSRVGVGKSVIPMDGPAEGG
jgi:hypothetical protein